MERIKDILFDLSDVVFSLIIIAVMFFVVSWQLNSAMPIQMTFFKPDEATVESAQVTLERETIQVTLTEDVATPKDQIDATQNTTVENTSTTEQIEVKSITINIPSGSSGDRIAKILQNNGVIVNAKAFSKTVADLNLGSRLRAGTFTFTNDMTNEEIAKKLAGQ